MFRLVVILGEMLGCACALAFAFQAFQHGDLQNGLVLAAIVIADVVFVYFLIMGKW
jgi:hypothetical protein